MSAYGGAFMADEGKVISNPKRVLAGRVNRMKRGPLPLESMHRMRDAINRKKPWQLSTGPRTPAGKAIVARNGKVRQRNSRSIREIRADISGIMCLIEANRESWEDVLRSV
jgi:hypothetical protein